MTINEKKDLIRFIGERLQDMYRAKAITLPVSYDLGTITDSESIKDVIFRFFLMPYDVYIEEFQKLTPGSNEYNAFVAAHPDITSEAEFVASSINSLIVEWVELQKQKEIEEQTLSGLYVDNRLRESVKQSMELFGVKKK